MPLTILDRNAKDIHADVFIYPLPSHVSENLRVVQGKEEDIYPSLTKFTVSNSCTLFCEKVIRLSKADNISISAGLTLALNSAAEKKYSSVILSADTDTYPDAVSIAKEFLSSIEEDLQIYVLPISPGQYLRDSALQNYIDEIAKTVGFTCMCGSTNADSKSTVYAKDDASLGQVCFSEADASAAPSSQYSASQSKPHNAKTRKEIFCPLSMDLLQDSCADLSSRIEAMDESFQQTLFRIIDSKGLTDPQVYKRANLGRKLFSKIRNEGYRPSKKTVLALCIALELTKGESDELLKKTGFALSPSDLSDVIVSYFLESGIYDIYEVNTALYSYDLQTLN